MVLRQPAHADRGSFDASAFVMTRKLCAKLVRLPIMTPLGVDVEPDAVLQEG